MRTIICWRDKCSEEKQSRITRIGVPTGATIFHELDEVSLITFDKTLEYTGSLIFANILRKSIPDENKYNAKSLRKEIVRHV